ncbi:MAG: methionine--tRNA ligase [Nitriliruptorales bacterium]|nr:methionine--tRNA ligase [Nitriliruptorales bacterium]
MTRHVLVAVAWPYANGQSHIGHFAGAYLPADIFARYHRIAGNRVLMVSGSDAHGTPITVKAEQEGVEPADIVNQYHPKFLEQWDRYGVSFDLFTTTMTDNHREVVWDMFRTLREHGHIDTRVTEQFYDPEAERFLPDRYVEGTCPNCSYDGARGDQCDNCGKTLDPTDLIEPHSKLTGATPELRETEHFFMLLPRLEAEVLSWLGTVDGWRPHVINWAKGFLKDGLIDRAITRDLTWGVPLPPEADTIGEGKRIYVWFEAVIGYLSASKEWAQQSGDPDAWKAWWEDPAAETYYFIGKDNIPFHAVFWPAYLIGYGGLNLPTDVPANQYVTFKGEKASKSRGIGTSLLEYLDDYQADAIRYAVGTVLPETNDNDFSEDDMIRRINDELVAAWGNLVNRVFSMTRSNFDGVVPEPGDLDEGDRDLLAEADRLLAEAGELLERVELRAALRSSMSIAQATNAYLNATQPWKTATEDSVRTATSLWTATQAIAAASIGLAPWLPFSTEQLRPALGLEADVVGAGWARPEVPAGTRLGDLEPMFAKVDTSD